VAQQGEGHVTQALEAHQHTLIRHLINEFFSRNLGQNNMLKNAYFLEKSYEIGAAPRGLSPRTPLASGGWGIPPPSPDPHVVTPTY